jgi:DNA polymerase III subunit epsilon
MLKLWQDNNFCIVDIETTGGNPVSERIIEIAILKIQNGELVTTYQSLVNPGKYVPPSIQAMTSISPEDLALAPSFEEIAQEVKELLEDSIFVAHNVRFDYSFVKNELKRAGFSFNSKCLCTVRLSKKIFKRYKHHDLSSLIERFDLKCNNRHRAYDDALVLWKFFQYLEKNEMGEKMEVAIEDLLHKRTLPQHIDEKSLEKLPTQSGVYIFYGPDDEVLYVGKSKNVKYRVMSHFGNDHSDGKEMSITQQVKRVEGIETSGELGALLLESNLIKTLSPIYNRMLRRRSELVLAKRFTNDEYHQIQLERSDSIDPLEYKNTLGVFKNLVQAKEFLKQACDEYKLCPKLVGLEKSKGVCFNSQIGKCWGACSGKDDILNYNKRLAKAFLKRRLRGWPFLGPVIIEEKRDDMEKHSFVIDNWCLIADIKEEDGGTEVITHSPAFDYDSYKIFLRYLSDRANKKRVKEISQKELDQLLSQESFIEEEVATIF